MSWRFKPTSFYSTQQRQDKRQKDKEHEEKWKKGKEVEINRSRGRTRKKKTVEIRPWWLMWISIQSATILILIGKEDYKNFYRQYLRIIRQKRILCLCLFRLVLEFHVVSLLGRSSYERVSDVNIEWFAVYIHLKMNVKQIPFYHSLNTTLKCLRNMVLLTYMCKYT